MIGCGAPQLSAVFDRRLTYHGIGVRPLRVRRMDLMWR
jgi:hypothetical protein